MLCLPAASHAQQINDSEKTAVEQVLNKCAVGVQTGRITVDSTAVAGDSLKLFASRNLTYLPIRKDSYMSIMDQVRGVLPEQLANKKITIIADRKDLKDLILRSDLKGKDKRQAFTQPKGTPLVRNLSRPYDATHGLDGKHIAMWQSHGLYYQQGLARWEWQRGRMFQSVEDKYTQSYVLPYVIPMLQNAGAVVMTPRERDTNPYEVVVDNDANMPVKQADGTVAKDCSVYAETNGAKAWTKGEGQGFAYLRPEYKDFENPFAEGSFRVADAVTKKNQESTISWTPDMPVDREYAVYVSYKTLPNSTSDARYTVYHKDGKTEFAVNQQMGGQGGAVEPLQRQEQRGDRRCRALRRWHGQHRPHSRRQPHLAQLEEGPRNRPEATQRVAAQAQHSVRDERLSSLPRRRTLLHAMGGRA